MKLATVTMASPPPCIPNRPEWRRYDAGPVDPDRNLANLLLLFAISFPAVTNCPSRAATLTHETAANGAAPEP